MASEKLSFLISLTNWIFKNGAVLSVSLPPLQCHPPTYTQFSLLAVDNRTLIAKFPQKQLIIFPLFAFLSVNEFKRSRKS